MHPYATDSREREVVLVGIVILCLSLGDGLDQTLNTLEQALPWYVEVPSVLGIVWGLWALFVNRLWKTALFRSLGVVRLPDLNGKWRAIIQTSFDPCNAYRAEVTITQTWTHISVLLETPNSQSRSLTASLLVKEPEITLTYEYRNDPKPGAPSTMHSHRGTAILRLKGRNRMEGEYYSGRDRQNYGSLLLEREAATRP